jgi:hypothetical protein
MEKKEKIKVDLKTYHSFLNYLADNKIKFYKSSHNEDFTLEIVDEYSGFIISENRKEKVILRKKGNKEIFLNLENNDFGRKFIKWKRWKKLKNIKMD